VEDRRPRALFSAVLVVALAAVGAFAQAPAPARDVTVLTVGVTHPGPHVPDKMFGVFFEDINFAADGGLYPERVKNRSFEFPDRLLGWHRAGVIGGRGSFRIHDEAPIHPKSPHYLRLRAESGAFGITNDGFRGMGVREGESYTVSLQARLAGGTAGDVRVELENTANQPLGGVTLTGLSKDWKQYTARFQPTKTESRARLRLVVTAPAEVDVDMVSLFPQDTFNQRPNGLRKDLVQLLKDMQPGFLRFPGGCIVEGRFLDGRYRWKSTIGDLMERELLVNRWNNEFLHRPTPDYYQSFGLGFYEYFLLAEDIGAAPLPILNCGMACQWNSSELAPLDELDPYIQDAIDLIEFANGPVTSPWGKKRAELGHPAPFRMKMLGVGNEQWGPQYVERYEKFAAVLKAKHPEIRLVASAGPSPSGERFDFLWQKMRELKADLVDEHYYQPPEWFLGNVHRYDGYPRTGPKVFAGEFAAHVRPGLKNTLGAAIAEAAFMTGLERNAEVVEMASYAPLLAHVDAWQWAPNLIWFDNLRSFGTPSYYVQQLFGAHQGSTLLPISTDGQTTNGTGGLYSSAALDSRTREVIVKLVNATSTPRGVRIDLPGARLQNAARAFVLTGQPDDENSLEAPTRVAPREQPLAAEGASASSELLPHSLTVVRLTLQ
jgi:alpha-L-arabinofuranosidase